MVYSRDKMRNSLLMKNDTPNFKNKRITLDVLKCFLVWGSASPFSLLLFMSSVNNSSERGGVGSALCFSDNYS